jgi:3-methylcrotonyl-CoA carboxylase alpha subunit
MIYEYEGARHSIELEPLAEGRYRVRLGERSYEIEADALPEGGWRLRLNGETLRAYAAADGNQRYVALQGNTYTLGLPAARSQQRKAAHTGDLSAQMPGQIVQVLVAPGDSVHSGQTLVIMEAMKMEMRVTAPRDGVIRGIFVVRGVVVERGQRLIDLG